MDENFAENPKIAKLKHPAFRLHVAALGYCSRNLTDGHVAERAVKVLAAILEFPPKRHIVQLVAVGLWTADANDDGFWINDYLIYNFPADKVKAIRDERSSAGKKGADARWGDGKSYGKGDSKRHMPQKQDLTETVKSREPADQSDPVVRLLVSIGNHADAGTERVVRKHALGLSEGDIAFARECCTGPGVENRAKVAVDTLKKRAADRAAA